MSLLSFNRAELYRQNVFEGYIDEDGNFLPGSKSWKRCCSCDFVPNGSALKISIPDGNVEYYSYTISNIPVCVDDFEYGDYIKLLIHGGKELILKVKGFHRYQLQCKIWA